VRTSSLLLSLLVHGAAVGAAVAVAGGMPGREVLRPPHVELMASEVPPPAPVPAELPAVEAEDPLAAEPLPSYPDPAEPFEPPPPRPEASWPLRERSFTANPRLWAPPPEPEPEPVVPVVAAPAPPPPEQGFVQAVPLADNPPPDYPARERALGREGTVVVRVHLDPRGRVLGAALAEPSRHPGLDRAALRAVAGWRFQPARRGGEAVESWLDVPVVFCLVDR